MFCVKCGKSVPEGTKICESCITINEEKNHVTNLSSVENNTVPPVKKKSKSMKVPFIVTSVIAITAILIIVFIMLFNNDSDGLMNEDCPQIECETDRERNRNRNRSGYFLGIPCDERDFDCFSNLFRTDDTESFTLWSEDGRVLANIDVPVGLGWEVIDENNFRFFVNDFFGACYLYVMPFSPEEDELSFFANVVYGDEFSTHYSIRREEIQGAPNRITIEGRQWSSRTYAPIEHVFAASTAGYDGTGSWIASEEISRWPSLGSSWSRLVQTTRFTRTEDGVFVTHMRTPSSLGNACFELAGFAYMTAVTPR